MDNSVVNERKSPGDLSRPGRSTHEREENRVQSIGDHQASDGVQRADLFTVALLGIARCGKTRSTGPLLRHDASGQQQQRDDEQGAFHAAALADLRRPTRLSAATMLSSVFKLGEWVCC